MTTARPFTSTRFFRDASTPMPSVVEPRSVPSGCVTTVLTLPQTAAASSTSCMWARMSTLYGRVTLAGSPTWTSDPVAVTPGETLELAIDVRSTGAIRKPSRESACSGTYTASMPRASKARLWRTGETLPPTSDPRTP